MHILESILEKETHEVLWDFENQMNSLNSARRPDLVRVTPHPTPENLPFFARELKKTMEHESDGLLVTVTKGLVQELEELEIRTRVENIQKIALLRSARILRRVLET